MPRIERHARVVWEGSLARGGGAISAGSSGAFTGLRYSNATRIGVPEGNTSPEELLAAAHAACFTNSLAAVLSGGGTPPGTIETHCLIVMDEVAGEGHRIVGSQITLEASIEGIEQDAFAEAVTTADEGCPFSALLKAAGASVAFEARLTVPR